MPSNWTRSDLSLGVEKGSLFLLLTLLGLHWLVECCSAPKVHLDLNRLEPKDAYQKISLGQRIDINRESQEGLMAIPRMTEKMAQKLVGYRKTYGPIKDESDIVRALGNRYKERIPEILSYVNLGTE